MCNVTLLSGHVIANALPPHSSSPHRCNPFLAPSTLHPNCSLSRPLSAPSTCSAGPSARAQDSWWRNCTVGVLGGRPGAGSTPCIVFTVTPSRMRYFHTDAAAAWELWRPVSNGGGVAAALPEAPGVTPSLLSPRYGPGQGPRCQLLQHPDLSFHRLSGRAALLRQRDPGTSQDRSLFSSMSFIRAGSARLRVALRTNPISLLMALGFPFFTSITCKDRHEENESH